MGDNFPTNFFRPYKMLSSRLNDFACVQGQLIFTTDTKRLYIDTTNTKAGRLEIAAEAITDVELGTDKRTLTFTKADGSVVNHKIVVDIDDELDEYSLNPIQNAVVAAAIKALQSTTSTNTGNINTIFEAIEALQSADEVLEDAIEHNANDIADNLAAIGVNADNIEALQKSVSDLNTKDGQLQSSINETNQNLTNFQTTTGGNFNTVNESISKILDGRSVVKSADNATEANHAIAADKATNDGNGNNIVDTYETKANASSNVTALQSYADNKANSALNDAKADAASKVSTHNVATDAHNDIRLLISDLADDVNKFLDVDDTTKDQLSEVLQLIDDNADTLESLTTSKVNVSDIVDNVGTSDSTKVLSAKQGVVLDKAITDLTTVVEQKATKTQLETHISDNSNPHKVSKDQVGLANVDNTSDANKPVSIAQAEAIADAKQAGTDAQSAINGHTANKSNPHEVSLTQLGVNATATELNLMSGVKSNVQDQLDDKADKSEIPTKYAGSASEGGAATSALKLDSAMTLTLDGDATGNVSFDGSKGVTLNVAVVDDSHNHVISNVDGLENRLSNVETKANNAVNSISASGTLVTYIKNDGTTDTFTTQDTTYNNATTSQAGLMSAEDKSKVNSLPEVVFCTKEQYASYGEAVKSDGKIYFIS